MSGKDTGYAPEQWAFDDQVTQVFDDMLARSIPQYHVMRAACFGIGSQFVQRSTCITDLGASRGEAIAPFVDKYGAACRYDLVEMSPPMLEVLRERFDGWLLTPNQILRVLATDIAHDEYPSAGVSLTLCILTLMFTPIERRQQVLHSIYEATIKGGALVIVEKILGNGARADDLLVGEYYALKKQNGYSPDEIERKRLSLEGVLVPVTARWNEELLHLAGFTQVECFWRWMNFAGWVAIKG